MAGRYARLTKDWMLRGWSDLPRMIANWATGDQRELKAMGFYVAQSCDGRTDFNSLAFLPRHHGLLNLLIAEGIAEECRRGQRIAPWQRYRKADNPRLAGIHWCVTGRCNLNCRHCYMQSPSARYGELSFDQMAALVDQFERANVAEVSLTGGEPFLRKDLLDLIALLAERKIRLSQIYSNGLLITDRHLERIREIGFHLAFQISFDGIGAHDQMRGTAGIEPRVIEAIRRIRAAGFPVAVATSIDRLNLAGLPATYELMKRLNVQAWRIAAPQPTGNWRGTTTGATIDEQAKACLALLKRWLSDGQPFMVQLAGFYTGGFRQRPGKAPSSRPAGSKTRNSKSKIRNAGGGLEYTLDAYDCGGCREQPNLLPDGTLVPCPGYVDSPLQGRMPNLLREELSEVWANSYLRQFADLRKSDVLARNPECAACKLFRECGAGCRAAALTETGDLMAKDPLTCQRCKSGYKKRFRELAQA